MSTATVDDNITEEQAREALQAFIRDSQEARQVIALNQQRVVRARTESEKIRAETRDTIARIQKRLGQI